MPIVNRRLRFCAFLLCLALCISALSSAEDIRGYTKEDGYVYVTLGRYPQTVDGGEIGNADDTWRWKATVIEDPASLELTDEPILWRVLSADEEKIWLLSEYILFASPMQQDYKAYKKAKGEFAQTDLCALLNTDFLTRAFTPEEASLLLPKEGIGDVFLLNAEDMNSADIGFGKKANKARKAWATEYAVRVTGVFVYKVKEGCCSPYWVATPAINAQAAGRASRCTKQDGSVGYYNVVNPEEGARPSVYLKPDAFTVDGGSGTKDDPWILLPATEAEETPAE